MRKIADRLRVDLPSGRVLFVYVPKGKTAVLRADESLTIYDLAFGNEALAHVPPLALADSIGGTYRLAGELLVDEDGRELLEAAAEDLGELVADNAPPRETRA